MNYPNQRGARKMRRKAFDGSCPATTKGKEGHTEILTRFMNNEEKIDAE